MKSKRTSTRSIEIRDGRLISSVGSRVVLELALADIAVVGELTTSGGPYSPDHFVVLVSDANELGVRVATESNGFEALREALRVERGIEFEFTLANRTDWSTAVSWPHDLCGRPLYEVHVVQRASGFFASWLDRVWPRSRVELTSAVRERCASTR